MNKLIKQGFFLIGVVAVLVSGYLVYSHINQSDGQNDEVYAEETDQYDLNDTKEFLAVGGYPDPEDNKANFNLYKMHIDINTISGNGTFKNGGKKLHYSQVQDYIRAIREYSYYLKYNGDNENIENKIEKVQEISGELFKEKAIKDDPRIQKLHDLIHELDKKFNANNSINDEKANEYGEPINN